MDSIRLLKKMSYITELNRDHKIVLLLLYDRYYSPSENKTMTPNELTSIDLYKISSVKSTLKELSDMGYVENILGHYQISNDLLYKMGTITFKIFEKEKTITDIIDFSITKLQRFLDEEPILQSQKQKLFSDLKITSNQNKTILFYFKEWFVDSDKKYNEYFHGLEN